MRAIAVLIALAWVTGSGAAFAQGAAKKPEAKKAPKAADKAEEKPADKPKERKNLRPAAPPETFESGLGSFYSGNYIDAAAKMYDYVATNQDVVENYEWAEYFLGVSLLEIGFTHGAAEYLYNVANNRSRPEILPDALQQLERLMDRPHDEGLLNDRLLTDSDFGYLPAQISDFVLYHQGISDLRARRTPWAERLFSLLKEDGIYEARATYALGVQRLKRNRMTAAVRRFRSVLEHPGADRKLRNQARLALARVLYESERYKSALKIYNQVEVPELTVAEASLYLEKAWTSYWMRDYRRTMGILYALEAPSYRQYFAPEKFLLRALVFKNLCHYIPAKREIRRFRFRFGETLKNIRARIDLREDDMLREAALQRGKLKRVADFRRVLAKEADRIDTIGSAWIEVGLDDQLRRLYGLKAQEVDLDLDARLRAQTRAVAQELVEFEEQMYLLDYEVGLDIYRRLKKENARRPTDQDNLEVPIAGEKAYYNFEDEFWNDELPVYQFLVENRCFDEGAKD